MQAFHVKTGEDLWSLHVQCAEIIKHQMEFFGYNFWFSCDVIIFQN